MRGIRHGIVVEIYVHIPPPFQIMSYSFGICRQLSAGIATGIAAGMSMAPKVDEICRKWQFSDIFRPVGHAEGNAGLTAERKHFLATPAFMPEFEGTADGIACQQLKEPLQTRNIAGKSGRQLPKDYTELFAEKKSAFKKAREWPLRVGKFFDMSNKPVPLDTEGKTGGGFLLPVHKDLRLQQAIEGDIQLDAGKDAAIVAEPPFLRKVVRIKAATPVRIAEAAAADEQFGHLTPRLFRSH